MLLHRTRNLVFRNGSNRTNCCSRRSSTMSCDMLTCVIRCKTSAQLWDKIHAFFLVHTHARSSQLRIELRATTLEGLTISKNFLKIQGLVDSLCAIGEPIPSREHLDIILEGLPHDSFLV